MAGSGIGAGLAALAFWGFLAVCVVMGVWADMRKREARHETLRRMIESGQPVDPALMDKILGGDNRLDRNLKAGGLILLLGAPGLAVLGWFLGHLAAWAPLPLYGVAVLVACIGVGLLVASKAIERSYR